MHAASVYPEPGSNSPKMHDLAAVTCSEGLTARTSLSRISCHSSIVKVQRAGHDGPRRRAPSMDSAALRVKPDDPARTEEFDPAACLHGGATRANGRVAPGACQTGSTSFPATARPSDRAALNEQNEGRPDQPRED